jgi:3-isopropylmalate/(R)-2-methylmalate dehydratase large subunit
MYHATKTQKMLIHVAGDLQLGVTPKDVALYIIKTIHFRRYWLFCGYAGKVLRT